jgi:hypothetical protein
LWFQASLGKKFTKPPSQSIKADMVAHTHHSNYTESISRRIVVQVGPEINIRPYLKNNESIWAPVVHNCNPHY